MDSFLLLTYDGEAELTGQSQEHVLRALVSKNSSVGTLL